MVRVRYPQTLAGTTRVGVADGRDGVTPSCTWKIIWSDREVGIDMVRKNSWWGLKNQYEPTS